MKEHLMIHNFGPICESDIELHDLTLFVGPQATGKSLAAQILYFLRGVEDPLLNIAEAAATPLEATLSALERWLGNVLSGHDPVIGGGIRAYVVLSKGRGVPQRQRERERLRQQYGVLVRTSEQHLEVSGIDAV
jgi:hypothetical protein